MMSKSYKNKLLYLLLIFIFKNFNAQIDQAIQEKKSWTFMVYMAAANDLGIFAPRNIKQMQKVGSNQHINIIVQHNFNEKKHTVAETFYIEKNAKKLLSEKTIKSHSERVSQGLLQFCCDTITHYPADHYALILWNHGTGALEPLQRSFLLAEEFFLISRSYDFFKNRETSLLTFPHFAVTKKITGYKGICFNDVSGTFITEEELTEVLRHICTLCPQNRLDIIGFDACFMAMIETAISVKKYAHFMVASQDVEPGTGWDYSLALFPFSYTCVKPHELSAHLVHAYAKKYKHVKDFTQSCIDLQRIESLENSINRISKLLVELLKSASSKKMLLLIKTCRNKHSCIHFDETDYIDLHNFYTNLLQHIQSVAFDNENATKQCEILQKELTVALSALNETVYENMTGQNFLNAKGISIYFPEHAMHSSYKKTMFAQSNDWFIFLKTYLSLLKK